jgi:D-alanyl-D-alanine carboxypeptidase (penicillin-binding protein 5/6)
MYPASLTKLMTLYLTFEALKANNISFDTDIDISRRAASMPRSNIGLRANNTIKVKEAILSLIVSSANDSAVALAEHLGDSESAFAKKMTMRAKQLGMEHTNFTNASGWHNPMQTTTAYDMAKLAIALKRDFPEYYHMFSARHFYYKGRLYRSHNRVNVALKGASGLKTGFTSKAGWNIVTAAQRGTTSLIGVVLGGQSHRSRDRAIIKLMNTHFARHTPHYKKRAGSQRASLQSSNGRKVA